MENDIATSKVCCPKCKSKSLTLAIWVGHTVEWEQKDGTFDRSKVYLNPGDPNKIKISGHCVKCDHKWTVRGAKQIDDVIKED